MTPTTTPTPAPTMIILYVADAPASAAFYGSLFGLEPMELSPGFALFRLPSGLVLGLWTRHTVEPKVEVTGGGSELAIRAETADVVDSLYAEWTARGIPMLQAPVAAEFGRTFTASDPDGHRIRVFNPPAR